MAKEQLSAQIQYHFLTAFYRHSCSSPRYSRDSVTSSFSSWTGPSVVILSSNCNHATGINWAVIAEALSTCTMLNCVHCTGTMTHNFWIIFSPNFFLLIPSVLLSKSSISLPFSSLRVCVYEDVCTLSCYSFTQLDVCRSHFQLT